jgi:anti-sigma factor RsiW
MPRKLTDRAGEYVLGLLEEPERTALERRMTDDPRVEEMVAEWCRHLLPLHDATPPEAPPSQLWASVQARIGATGTDPARLRSEGVWLSVAPGVAMRMLYVDPPSGTRSAIMSMAAGSVVPAHQHDALEECFVIDGSIRIDDAEYGAGDHVFGRRGSPHPTIASSSGASLLLHWSPAAA